MAVNQALRQEVARRREAWKWLTASLRRLETWVNKSHSYATKINGKGGYISEKNLSTLAGKMIEMLTYVDVCVSAFEDMGTVLTGTPGHISPK